MRYIRLSHALEENSPVHIGLKKLEIIPNSQITEGGSYNSYIISLENHCGTHIDAPGHFIDEGRIITDYGPNELIFKKPLILELPKKEREVIRLEEIHEVNFEGRDCIIFRTGFEKHRESDPETYLTLNPGIDPELIYWIRKYHPEIRCIGMDCVSISSYGKPEQGKEAHLNAFTEHKDMGEPLVLVEDMKLAKIEDLNSIETIIVVPWQIREIDSAPCTVIARMK